MNEAYAGTIIMVVCVEPGKSPTAGRVGNDQQSLAASLEADDIQEIFPFEDEDIVLICDESGKLNGKEPNRALRDNEGKIYDIIYGTFFLAGFDNEDLVSLTPEQILKYGRMFMEPEVYISFRGEVNMVPLSKALE